jgi:hypothetical protein
VARVLAFPGTNLETVEGYEDEKDVDVDVRD